MSTATISRASTTPTPHVGVGGDVTLARVAGSEWIKFRSLRSSWYMLGSAVALLPIFGAVVAYNTRTPTGLAAEDAVPSAVLQGYNGAQLLVGVLGVLFVTGEYGTGMIRSTLAAVPRRVPVLLAKAGIFVAVSLVPMLVASLATFLGAEAFLSHYGHGYSLSDPTALRVVLGTGIYLTLVGLRGAALGWILRSTAGGIAALVGLVLVTPVLFQLLGAWGRDLGRFLPSNAGGSFVSSLAGDHMLGPWSGLGVLVAWVAVALVAAATQLRRRDA